MLLRVSWAGLARTTCKGCSPMLFTNLCRHSHTGAELVAVPAPLYASWQPQGASPLHETASLHMPCNCQSNRRGLRKHERTSASVKAILRAHKLSRAPDPHPPHRPSPLVTGKYQASTHRRACPANTSMCLGARVRTLQLGGDPSSPLGDL